MNNLQTRVEVVRPINTSVEVCQWDKQPKTVKQSEVAELTATTQIHITPEIYSLVYDLLMDMIDGQDYISDSVIFDFGDLECHFEFSLCIYSRRESYPEGVFDQIYDLVPTWWEFHTLKDGEEFLNDFSFAEFKKYL